MRFFVPHASDDTQSKDVLLRARKNLINSGIQLYDAEVYQMAFTHEGKTHIETVGRPSGINGQTIILILEGANLFYIHTLTRGLEGGEPILAGKNFVSAVIYFDHFHQEKST